MSDGHYEEVFDRFIKKNPEFLEVLEEEAAQHEENYKDNTSQLIKAIRENPPSTSKIRQVFEDLKTKFEHRLHHRPSFTEQNKEVEKELEIREEEIVQEFEVFATKMQKKLNLTQNRHELKAMGGELLEEYKINQDNKEIRLKTRPIFLSLFSDITRKIYESGPQSILGFHVM